MKTQYISPDQSRDIFNQVLELYDCGYNLNEIFQTTSISIGKLKLLLESRLDYNTQQEGSQ